LGLCLWTKEQEVEKMPEKRGQALKIDELHVVTPEMIDWFWANMEKGFVLWHPTEHKGFEWDPSPAKNGFVGAVHVVGEQIGGVLALDAIPNGV